MIFLKNIMKLSDYDFNLPPELIAQHPVKPRDHSRLLVLGETLKDRKFYDIIDLLKKGDVLVFNNTKVIPAKLSGKIKNSLGEFSSVSFNLNTKKTKNSWSVFAKPAKKLSLNKEIVFSNTLKAVVMEEIGNGEFILQFNKPDTEFLDELYKIGSMPLPQYIRKGLAGNDDNTDYQTVYAKESGAVAAPTAGLHFTDQLLEKIAKKGVKFAYVTLHVGAGTFLPVKSECIDEHKMHSEYISLDSENAKLINDASRVVAVGTTTVRTLESIALKKNKLEAYSGETNIFIKPGFKFNVVDVLITNFHLPKSTLLILLTTFGGYDRIMSAYKHAISQKYRFFSYGDACWVDRA